MEPSYSSSSPVFPSPSPFLAPHHHISIRPLEFHRILSLPMEFIPMFGPLMSGFCLSKTGEWKSTSYALLLEDAELVGERYVAPAVLMALRKR